MIVVYARGRRAINDSCTCFTVASPSGHNAFMQSNSNGARSRIDRRRSPFGEAFGTDCAGLAITEPSSQRNFPAALPISIAPALRRALPDLEDTSQAVANGAPARRRVPSIPDRLYQRNTSRASHPSLSPDHPDNAASLPRETSAILEIQNHIARDGSRSCASPARKALPETRLSQKPFFRSIQQRSRCVPAAGLRWYILANVRN